MTARDPNHENDPDAEVVAYEFEVKGPSSGKWRRHISPVEDLPDDPKDAWRDDHKVRNVRPLVYADEE